jgi:hypothetical protein
MLATEQEHTATAGYASNIRDAKNMGGNKQQQER